MVLIIILFLKGADETHFLMLPNSAFHMYIRTLDTWQTKSDLLHVFVNSIYWNMAMPIPLFQRLHELILIFYNICTQFFFFCTIFLIF